MTDADLQAKPQVLLLGQHSTGKTSVSARPLSFRDHQPPTPEITPSDQWYVVVVVVVVVAVCCC